MSAPKKQTKKQKKAAAFRDHKQRKGKSHARAEEDPLDVPIAEDQDLADLQIREVEDEQELGGAQGGAREGAAKGRSAAKSRPERDESKESGVERPPGKRKREQARGEAQAAGVEEKDGEEGGAKAKRKRRKTVVRADEEFNDKAEDADTDAEGEEGDMKQGRTMKKRYILFVGNLKYTTSLEALRDHFSACDPPPTIRLLTPKRSSTGQKSTSTKSKGCAFLEFIQRSGLQQALQLHQSELDGRRINVELTAGGGGKSEDRLKKLRERNQALHTQRKKQTERQQSATDEPQRPQRYSATSGLEMQHAGKRTWTVGDIEDEGQTHRGGQKHTKGKKKGRPKAKDWGTGVNAIPVG